MAADSRYGITAAIVGACYHRIQINGSSSPTTSEVEDMIDRAAAEASRIIQRRIAG